MTSYRPERNPLHVIAGTSLVLGVICGTSALLISQCRPKYKPIFLHLIVLSIYHLNEFNSTARFQPTRVHSNLFLITGNKGNKEFLFMQFFAIFERLVSKSSMAYRFFDNAFQFKISKEINWVALCLGLMLAVSGLSIRFQAMKTCGESFSHDIETINRNQELVTTGIYKYSRHPSYLGFWMFAAGCQVYLENWIGLVLNITILSVFFKKRIEFEEWFLVNRIFGDEYLQYRKRVGTWIPFVVVPDIESKDIQR